ncbi:MAG: hypothetical protein Harvfovirus22_18 [Harvfovirus sp.]|uniref:Uncharacterized protein n=1 Tax=Harvfovirus sp. TaxID=2487768 RepID=A0A3G5A5Z1_9VIRU|nr:MAG: hypothetical protein Harvfovirus22_18 [Harvfovirus sp.]
MAVIDAWQFCHDSQLMGVNGFLCPVYKSELLGPFLHAHGIFHEKFIDVAYKLSQSGKDFQAIFRKDGRIVQWIQDCNIRPIVPNSTVLNCALWDITNAKNRPNNSCAKIWNNVYDLLRKHLSSDENELRIDDLSFLVKLIWSSVNGNRLAACDLKLQKHRRKVNAGQIREITCALAKVYDINWTWIAKIINEYYAFGCDFFPMWEQICGDYSKYNRSVALVVRYIDYMPGTK